MPGFHAADVLTRHDMDRRGLETWSVDEHFTSQSPYEPDRNGEHKSWMISGTPLPVPGKKRLQFHFIDCSCTEHYIIVYNGAESMRMDLPDIPADRWSLVQHVMQRSGDRPSPEVIRFRPGRFAYAELMIDTVFDKLEARLAKRLKDAENASYKKQLAELEAYYRNLPPPALPVVASVSPPPLEQAQGEAEMAKQPGLGTVLVDRLNADIVWVRITGCVMLDGSCASGMPLFGIEMLTDTGWVERIACELEQMDCGLPSVEWDQHVVMMPPLRWWIGAHRHDGNMVMVPGTYRLVFVGADRQYMRTDALELK